MLFFHDHRPRCAKCMGPKKVQNTTNCCRFFRDESCSSDRRQYSENLGVTWPIIIGAVPTGYIRHRLNRVTTQKMDTRILTNVGTSNTICDSVLEYKNTLYCSRHTHEHSVSHLHISPLSTVSRNPVRWTGYPHYTRLSDTVTYVDWLPTGNKQCHSHIRILNNDHTCYV
jgi:hypothetical protein